MRSRAPPRGVSRGFLVGGGTAVCYGWRASTIDVDLHGEPERLFANIQDLKERLRINVEFTRPEDFVPPLASSEARHLYAQAFSKIVRGFDRDLEDAGSFVTSGLLEPARLRELVHGIPARAYARYPALTRKAVLEVVDEFVRTHPATRLA